MEYDSKQLDLVSIVVPIYNVELYLEKTIKSIIAQTYKRLEIILVDDGSTDSSGMICDFFSTKDSRIHVIHKENGGLVSSRKAGVNAAKGKYLLMIDGDDWVEPSIVDYLYNIIIENDVEFVTSGMIKEYKGTGAKYVDGLEEGVYSGERKKNINKRIVFLESEMRHGILYSACAKLFLTDQIKKIYEKMDDEIENGEDLALVYPIAFNSSGFYISHKCLYHYVLREKSISNSVNKNFLLSMQKWYDFVTSSIRDIEDHEIKKQIDTALVKLLLRGINYHMGLNEEVTIPSYLLPHSVPVGKVALYGAGKVGQAYYSQLINDDRYELVAWVDEKWNGCTDIRKHVEYLSICSFDILIIAIIDEDASNAIKENLVDGLNISREKLFWKKPIAILDEFIKW